MLSDFCLDLIWFWTISIQCSISILLENVIKPGVYRGYINESLGSNRLMMLWHKLSETANLTAQHILERNYDERLKFWGSL